MSAAMTAGGSDVTVLHLSCFQRESATFSLRTKRRSRKEQNILFVFSRPCFPVKGSDAPSWRSSVCAQKDTSAALRDQCGAWGLFRIKNGWSVGDHVLWRRANRVSVTTDRRLKGNHPSVYSLCFSQNWSKCLIKWIGRCKALIWMCVKLVINAFDGDIASN